MNGLMLVFILPYAIVSTPFLAMAMLIRMFRAPKQVKTEVVAWIRDYFEKNGSGCTAVVGISGGKDSTVAAALCVEALGKDRVLGVMMPQHHQADIADSLRVVEALGIGHATVNIGNAVDSMLAAIMPSVSPSTQAVVNLPARVRMATLYAIAQSLPNGGRVVNTCNRSEDFVGYSTKFGDSAGDFSPLSNMLVEEVRQIGRELPIPVDLVDKTPSDGLCGKTDEDNLGFSYETLDHYIIHGECDDEAVRAKIEHLHACNLHKLLPMPAFDVDDRPRRV